MPLSWNCLVSLPLSCRNQLGFLPDPLLPPSARSNACNHSALQRIFWAWHCACLSTVTVTVVYNNNNSGGLMPWSTARDSVLLGLTLGRTYDVVLLAARVAGTVQTEPGNASLRPNPATKSCTRASSILYSGLRLCPAPENACCGALVHQVLALVPHLPLLKAVPVVMTLWCHDLMESMHAVRTMTLPASCHWDCRLLPS